MKILVLTQYLHTNYGGLLQAYALQKVLKELGHDVKTEDRRPVKKNNFEKVKFSGEGVTLTIKALPCSG